MQILALLHVQETIITLVQLRMLIMKLLEFQDFLRVTSLGKMLIESCLKYMQINMINS